MTLAECKDQIETLGLKSLTFVFSNYVMDAGEKKPIMGNFYGIVSGEEKEKMLVFKDEPFAQKLSAFLIKKIQHEAVKPGNYVFGGLSYQQGCFNGVLNQKRYYKAVGKPLSLTIPEELVFDQLRFTNPDSLDGRALNDVCQAQIQHGAFNAYRQISLLSEISREFIQKLRQQQKELDKKNNLCYTPDFMSLIVSRQDMTRAGNTYRLRLEPITYRYVEEVPDKHIQICL